MSAGTIIALVTALATTTVKLLEKTPDYKGKEKERFFELNKLFNEELVKPKSQWDSNALLNLHNEILLLNKIIIKGIDSDKK